MKVIIFCDFVDKEKVSSLVATQKNYCCEVISLPAAPALHKELRKVVCSHAREECCFINWCQGTKESTDRACAIDVATALEIEYKVPFVGNSVINLRYDIEDIRMLMFYSDLPTNNFVFVKQPKDVAQASRLKFPVEISYGDIVIEVSTVEKLEDIVAGALNEVSTVLITESFPTSTHLVTVNVLGNDVVIDMTPLKSIPDFEFSKYLIFFNTVAKSIIGVKGYSLVSIIVNEDNITLANVCFNCGIPLNDTVTMEKYLDSLISFEIKQHATIVPRHVISFDAVAKGYFMRAARNLLKDEIVFEDERRTFAIVTRKNVAETWSKEDKYTFSRYAWPLDCEGHVYAIWEADPKRWRPINHSCDPNLVFAVNHSLNVIAARNIKESEDLTMDYATFCDGTMKPFQCYCNSSMCRGMITSDKAALEKYGTNSWHRHVPPPVENLLSDI